VKATEELLPVTIPEPAPPAPDMKAANTADPGKETLNWLRKKQYIIKHTEPEKPVVKNGAIEYFEPPKSEWRITGTLARITHELLKAAKNKEIPLEEDMIQDFILNNLKTRLGDDIIKKSLSKTIRRTFGDNQGQTSTK
jgi:hypothetical protein